MADARFATYDAALDWLFGATDYEQMRRVRYNADTFDLTRMEALLARLADPRPRQRYMHVAGTKGKGSTAAMLSAVLAEAGHRVGLYVSPHVVDLRERICVDGSMIAPEALRDLLSRVRPPVEAMRAEAGGRGPTFFEILTAAALCHFQAVKTDAAVLEVGLGGRLDATNVVTPIVSCITSLSMDHMEQLGDTLAQIAGEKAGIIKPGVPVVSAPQMPEALAVIEMVAARQGAPLLLVGREIEVTAFEYDARDARVGSRISLRTPRQEHVDVWLALAGPHQAVNAAVAVGALELAAERGLDWDAAALRAGLGRAAPPARIEVLGRRPTVINDGAHNPAGLAALRRVVEEAFPHDRLVLVFASAADKDYAAGLAEIAPAADHVILTTSGSPRSAAPADLERAVRRVAHVPVDLVPDARAAADRALALARPDDLVCFTGSFYLAGLVAEWWSKRPKA
jgi:dihydrofolate synthase/folylpolyglutamate synthase